MPQLQNGVLGELSSPTQGKTRKSDGALQTVEELQVPSNHRISKAATGRRWGLSATCGDPPEDRSPRRYLWSKARGARQSCWQQGSQEGRPGGTYQLDEAVVRVQIPVDDTHGMQIGLEPEVGAEAHRQSIGWKLTLSLGGPKTRCSPRTLPPPIPASEPNLDSRALLPSLLVPVSTEADGFPSPCHHLLPSSLCSPIPTQGLLCPQVPDSPGPGELPLPLPTLLRSRPPPPRLWL